MKTIAAATIAGGLLLVGALRADSHDERPTPPEQHAVRVCTMIPHQSLDRYVRMAPIIVRARLLGSHEEVHEIGLGITVRRFQAIDVVKGTVDSQFEVVAGGSQTLRPTFVANAPEFMDREEALLFLTPAGPDGRFGFLGLRLGKYEILQAGDHEQIVGLHAAFAETYDAFRARLDQVVRRHALEGEEVGR